jgi:NitT/TauT family transport system permease protein
VKIEPRVVEPLAALAGVVIAWQAAVTAFDVQPYILPSPLAIGAAMVKNWSTLLRHAGVTLYETITGFGLSILIGIPIAVAIVYSRRIENIVYPILVASQAVPKIAVAPLFLVWLGYGAKPKILVALLIAFFPVVVDTVTGLESVSPEMLQLVRSMGASRLDTFRKIRFPTAMPHIFSGLKIAIALAVVGAVVGEFIGSNSGLGHYILVATGNFDTPLVFASIVLLTVMGIGLFYLVAAVERLATPWHRRTREDMLRSGSL